ncbi:MAG: hypothetical protein KF868_08245 [Acidobacteria bacterium]|nr:hypothetical protein [Acidobacteriota bacterium]MCW5971317.1 hypothetical protein [Blastocatellales bacterium]
MIVRVLVCLMLLAPSVWAQTASSARRAVVCDERISALRERPEMQSPLRRRLRRGRVVWVTGSRRTREGVEFLRVAVTRRTSGWVMADAVARRGVRGDALRLIELIESSADDFVRIRLAQIAETEFRGSPESARALLLLGEAADRAAQNLTRLSMRRVKTYGETMPQQRRVYLLNDPALDRYSRLGVRFTTDAEAERLVYDGAAYRELIRRYPGRPETATARERIGKQER